jgi:hypothetical protein
MIKKIAHPPTKFSIEVDGQEYSATYRFERGVVSVFAVIGYSSKRAGDSPEETAKMLLRELVRAENA